MATVLAAAVLVLAGLAVPPAAAAPSVPDDLPDGVPAAALRAEPELPAPAGWPFPEGAPRTSGTGRLVAGAALWSDFLYDDRGPAAPLGAPLNAQGPASVGLAPTQGVYSYPPGPAHGNGADVFRTGIGSDGAATYWRVDWNTLADPVVPIAAWTFDTDDDPRTGTAEWPAAAGVRSPGIDRALVVSSRGARLLDADGGLLAELPTTVDTAARSFVVRVPRAALDVDGTWRVRLAAGLADAAGTGFAPPTVLPGAAVPGLPRVYNVAFRSVEQEPPVHTSGLTDALVARLQELTAAAPLLGGLGADGAFRAVTGNFWLEDAQADALALGDVSPFSSEVDWAALASGVTTPESRPTGYSNRWYVSRLALGDGIVPQAGPAVDLRPNYLGRVQPYAVYVPTDGGELPLTWVMHSLGGNHNQYGALNPRLLEQLCEDRGSICATTLGHGPDGWYYAEAEADYWQVWRALAEAYELDTERTVMSGYSMGGWASYKLTFEHPDLFAAAMPLAGPPRCGSGLGDPVPPLALNSDERCDASGDTGPLVGNARWVPYSIGHGAADLLVPVTAVQQQVGRFDALGQRYVLHVYPGEDHVAFAVQDRFDAVVAEVGSPARVRDPGRISHTWYPSLTDDSLGLGATTVYWLGGLAARDTGPGRLASVEAVSAARPDPAVTERRTGPTLVPGPLPALRTALEWVLGEAPEPSQRLELVLHNVVAVSVDLERAGLRCGPVSVTSDGPVTVTLGIRAVDLPAGRSTLQAGC